MQLQIARAASMLVSYDAGYYLPFPHTKVISWNDAISYTIKNGCVNINSVCKPLYNGTVFYTASLEKSHPGYLHSLYRYTTKALGVKGSFTALAIVMSQKNRAPSKSRFLVNITQLQLNNWCVLNNGKEYSPTEKPLDSPKHIQKRLVERPVENPTKPMQNDSPKLGNGDA